MLRRNFLGLASASAAGIALPGWLAQGFGSRPQDGWSPPEGGARNGDVADPRDAWRRARAAGRPLLVLTIPAELASQFERGSVWGELLMNGSAECLSDLALCDVVCAELAVLRRALPGLPGLSREESLAVLIESDDPRAQAVDAELPSVHFRWGENDANEIYEREVRGRIAELEAVLREALAPDESTLERRARACATALGIEVDPPLLDPTRSTRRGARAEARRAPAMVRLAAERTPARRKQLIGLLAGVAAERLQVAPPPGALWASSTGCGLTVEGREDEGLRVACGMGHTPEISRRFLYFFKDV